MKRALNKREFFTWFSKNNFQMFCKLISRQGAWNRVVIWRHCCLWFSALPDWLNSKIVSNPVPLHTIFRRGPRSRGTNQYIKFEFWNGHNFLCSFLFSSESKKQSILDDILSYQGSQLKKQKDNFLSHTWFKFTILCSPEKGTIVMNVN